MAENSNIEWCDHTFNPWIGCQKVSPGCDHCYAETQNNHRKWNGGSWGPHAPRTRTSAAYWKNPLKWARRARELGVRPSVFCASLADVFDNKSDERDRADLWKLIWETPELDWLLLSKRPENILDMLPESWTSHRPEWSHVWLGTTCEDQAAYYRRWPILREIPAAVRFISYEPAIGPLRLDSGPLQPDWLICGGESGPNARHMPEPWAIEALYDCHERRIAFFMKQMTKRAPIPAGLMVRQFPTPRGVAA